MAREVPYQPYPTADPIAGTGARSISVPANSDAFGGQIAQAVKGLGGSMEHVGNELFNRAVAIQDLQNETEARKADTDYMIAAGQSHAEFNALQGQDRVTALPGHMQNLKQLREDIRSKLSNPAAQKMYDAQSLSTMGRTIFNAAGAAASAQKDWSINTAKSQLDLDAKTVEDSPADDVLFQQKLNRVRAGADNLAALHGMGEGSPQAQDLSMKAVSQLWKQRIIGLSRTDPFGAAKMLDANKTSFTGSDYLMVDNAVRSQARAVGSAKIANDVYHNGQDQNLSLGDMEIAAREKAKQFDKDDPILAEHAVTALRGIWNQDKYAKKQEDYENNQTIAEGIAKGVRDERELRLDPAVASAIDALPPKKRLEIPGMINRFNASRDKVTNQDNFTRLNGMAANAPEDFLNTDLTKEQLGYQDIRYLQAKQAKLKQNQNADPRVGRAVTWIRGAMGAQMEALGVYRRTDSNKDDYDHFTGALQSALDEWTETHSKPPDYHEVIEKIAPRLMQTHTEKGWIFSSQVPFFKAEMPDDVKQKLTDDVTTITGTPPSEAEVYKAYVRAQYNKLYGAKKDQAQVPK